MLGISRLHFHPQSEMNKRLRDDTQIGHEKPSQGIQDFCDALRKFERYADIFYKEIIPLGEKFARLNFSKDKKELTEDELVLYVQYSYKYKEIKNY